MPNRTSPTRCAFFPNTHDLCIWVVLLTLAAIEVYAVLAFIKSTWPSKIQAAQQRRHQ